MAGFVRLLHPGPARRFGKSEIIAAERVGRVAAGAPRRGKGDAVAEGQNRSELPAIGNPLSRAGPRFGEGSSHVALRTKNCGPHCSQRDRASVSCRNNPDWRSNSRRRRQPQWPNWCRCSAPGECTLNLKTMAYTLGHCNSSALK